MYLNLLLHKVFGRNYKSSICGHTTKRFARVKHLSGKIFVTLPRKIEYCADCIAKMTIRCAGCECPIIVGDPIILYTPFNDDFPITEHAVVYNKDPLQLVMCINCAYVGHFWVEPRKIERTISLIEEEEMAMAAKKLANRNNGGDSNKMTTQPQTV